LAFALASIEVLLFTEVHDPRDASVTANVPSSEVSARLKWRVSVSGQTSGTTIGVSLWGERQAAHLGEPGDKGL